MGIGTTPRTRKKITRVTDTGRLESEIEQSFLSKGEADETFQRIRVFKRQPKVDDLMDGEMARVSNDDELDFFVRHGKNLYRLNATKVE